MGVVVKGGEDGQLQGDLALHGWVGGWVERGRRGGWNEVLDVGVGWVNGWRKKRRVERGAVGGWVGGWVGGLYTFWERMVHL